MRSLAQIEKIKDAQKREVADYLLRLKREYESLSDEELARWIQGHLEGCRHAMLNGLPYSAAAYGWKLHKMWQEVERRRGNTAHDDRAAGGKTK